MTVFFGLFAIFNVPQRVRRVERERERERERGRQLLAAVSDVIMPKHFNCVGVQAI